MNDRTKRLSDFRVKLNANKDFSLPTDFAYITDDYNAVIEAQNEENSELKLQVQLLEQKIKRYETVTASCRILIDSMEETGFVRVGDPDYF